MRRRAEIVFLGFILITSPLLAAPDQSLDLSDIKSSDVNKKEDDSLKDLSLATPPEKAPKPPGSLYSGAFVFNLVTAIRPLELKEENGDSLGILYGLELQLPSNTGHRWEVGGAIATDDIAEVLFGYRYIFDIGEKVRPQVRVAWSSLLPKGAGSIEFLSVANWRGDVALGLENLVWKHGGFRIEVGGSGRPGDIEVRIALGFIWLYSGRTLQELRH